ncbi:hypothetical protein PV05_09783 [Exophiala xenobiotica]|uniref:Uncharacterized protein n=1 Tax=Exophiala xenobiotica TaxID=348802 RepID=A0A0D2ET95_9EURO|nr:uncharacterized protein PV05_09783 [Exophiala xenobiotica]KIW51024.1 hypothetical protein PV05_09783 [Exophiala xenobiotica]
MFVLYGRYVVPDDQSLILVDSHFWAELAIVVSGGNGEVWMISAMQAVLSDCCCLLNPAREACRLTRSALPRRGSSYVQAAHRLLPDSANACVHRDHRRPWTVAELKQEARRKLHSAGLPGFS